MRLFHYFIFTLLMLISPFMGRTQFAIQKDPEVAKNAMTRKLLVELDEPDKKDIKSSKKDGNYEVLMQYYKDKNDRLLSYYKKYWTLGNEIIPISKDELDSIQKLKSTEYMFATCNERRDTKQVTKNGMKSMRSYTYNIFYLGITDSKLKSLGAVASRGRHMNDLEYIFAINTTQYFLKFISEGNERGDLEETVNKSAPEIKGKTLLIPDYLSDMTLEEMKAVYPYPVQIASEEEILGFIDRKDKNYAYVILNHDSGTCGEKFHQFILDCNTGRPLLFDKKSNINVTDNNIDSYFEDKLQKQKRAKARLITPKNLESYLKIITANS